MYLLTGIKQMVGTARGELGGLTGSGVMRLVSRARVEIVNLFPWPVLLKLSRKACL